jgi:hypothetical protein
MMPEDILQAAGGDIAGEAGDDIAQDVFDLVGKLARQELERRHPGPVVEERARGSLSRAITSDELDAQVPEGTVPPEKIGE